MLFTEEAPLLLVGVRDLATFRRVTSLDTRVLLLVDFVMECRRILPSVAVEYSLLVAVN